MLYLWKIQSETQKFLTEVLKEIKSEKEIISDNHQILHKSSEQIAHERLYHAGIIAGLNKLVKYIEDIKDDEDR